jgi:hypothetical protein
VFTRNVGDPGYAQASFSEIATLATHDAMETGQQLRAGYLAVVRAAIRAGVDRGQFRPVDVDVTSLLIFGCLQWAWTWYRRAAG